MPDQEAVFDRDDRGVEFHRGVHGGNGEIAVKYFAFDGAAEPALLLIYDIPPGASEGLHTHARGDEVEGSYDEFYYVLEGSGTLQVGDEFHAVRAGDHVYVPNGLARGVENADPSTRLRIYLIAMRRDD
jgi:mannose-6-phosphate isomerase-like protein (cupin superfamily)